MNCRASGVLVCVFPPHVTNLCCRILTVSTPKTDLKLFRNSRPVSQRTQVSFADTSLFRGVIAVSFGSLIVHINTVNCVGKTQLCGVKAVLHTVVMV
jgi:hypothetical protein